MIFQPLVAAALSWGNFKHAMGFSFGFKRGTRLIMGNGLVGRLLYDLRKLAVNPLSDCLRMRQSRRRDSRGRPQHADRRVRSARARADAGNQEDALEVANSASRFP